MEKRRAFTLSLVITFLIAGNSFVFSALSESEIQIEPAVIARAIDGDTIELADGRKARLININAPETGEFTSQEAVLFLKQFESKPVNIGIVGVDHYGRLLIKVYYAEIYLNLKLVEEGFTHPYLVRDNELKEFVDARKEARQNEKGIWQKSNYSGCLEVKIKKKEEKLLIEDNCGLDFKGWTIKDEGWRSFQFQNSFSSDSFIFNSQNGSNPDELYWERDTAVWNTEKNSLFIRDDKGFLAYYDSYGY